MSELREFNELIDAYRAVSPSLTLDEARQERVRALERLVSLTAESATSEDQIERSWHALLQLRLLYEQGYATRKHLQAARLDAGLVKALDAAMGTIRDRTMAATAAKQIPADRHRTRARELRREGLSAAQIGQRIAYEEHRKKPYVVRTIWKWLSK